MSRALKKKICLSYDFIGTSYFIPAENGNNFSVYFALVRLWRSLDFFVDTVPMKIGIFISEGVLWTRKKKGERFEIFSYRGGRFYSMEDLLYKFYGTEKLSNLFSHTFIHSLTNLFTN